MNGSFITKISTLLKKLVKQNNHTCVYCDREIFDERYFCQKCLQSLPFNDQNCCQICGRMCEDSVEICNECLQDRPLYHMAKSNFIYNTGMRKLLYQFKNGDRYLVDAFVPFVDFFLGSTLFDIDCITYVPMFYADEKQRGYNQAKVLATAIATRYNIPLAEDKLLKIRQTKKQKTLNKANRMHNLKESFAITDKNYFHNKKVLLVDDILTTGATSDTLTACLKENGCNTVYLYTIASVPLQKEN